MERQHSHIHVVAGGPHRGIAGRTAAQIERSAMRSHYYRTGYCLQWSRKQAQIPGVYADAATAWSHATGKRPGDLHAPAGAAVYWTGGSAGHGHIAISVGDGQVRSTDAGGEGRVATRPIEWFSQHWHLRYAGWSNSINGYRILGIHGRDHHSR